MKLIRFGPDGLEKTGVIKKGPAKGDKPTAEIKPNSPNFK